MVDPEVAGTAFSVEVSTGYPAIHIAASYGLGEAVVSGQVTSDEWLIDPASLITIKRVRGAKKEMCVTTEGESGTVWVDVPASKRELFCIEDAKIKEVAEIIAIIQRVYNSLFGYEHIDTEFGIDANSREVRMLQSRPVVELDTNTVETVDPKGVNFADEIVQGTYSLLGAVSGRCNVIKDFEALVRGEIKIDPNDILVTAKTSNYWNQYLTNLKGIITLDGSPTAHPMLIGRERNLPVICGVPRLIELLQPLHGLTITMDGLSKWVYKGEKALRSATREEFQLQFEVQEPVKPRADDGIKDFLKQYAGRLITRDSEHYVRNPNTPITAPWAALRMKLYEERIKLINKARDEPIEDPFVSDVIYEGGYVADKLVPSSQTMKAFEGMSLTEIKRYHSNIEHVCEQYIEACASFMNEPNYNNWRAYTWYYPGIYAALWNSFFWRMYLKVQSSTMANELGVSTMIYEAMLQNYQSRMAGYELDNLFRRDICQLATKVGKRITMPATAQKVLDHGRDSDCRCMGRLKRLSRDYRIGKNEDISNDYPFLAVAEKVAEAINEGSVFVEENLSADLFEFMPESPTLNEYIEEHIRSRMQNSNCHHLKKRGQSMIKQGLMKISCALQIPLAEIINAADLNAVERYVYAFERLVA